LIIDGALNAGHLRRGAGNKAAEDLRGKRGQYGRFSKLTLFYF